MDRIQDDTATAQDQFTEGDPGAGTLATIIRALWLNGVQEELVKLLELAGIAPDANTWDQIWKALQKLTVQRLTGTDTGTANAHVVNPDPGIDAYRAGQIISYSAGGTNTDAITLNVSNKGDVALKRSDGGDMRPGDVPAGMLVVAIHDGTVWIMTRQVASQMSGLLQATWFDAPVQVLSQVTVDPGANGTLDVANIAGLSNNARSLLVHMAARSGESHNLWGGIKLPSHANYKRLIGTYGEFAGQSEPAAYNVTHGQSNQLWYPLENGQLDWKFEVLSDSTITTEIFVLAELPG